MDNNFISEPSEAYITSKKAWTSKLYYDKSELVGGYGSYINEIIRMAISQKSFAKQDLDNNEELDYKNYHFKNEELKFNRGEINER